tara:strand:- start:967 stop:1200 length:234 start_codon:yes stop_codon:yes gene_type:complete
MAERTVDPHNPAENIVPYVYREFPRCLYRGAKSRIVADSGEQSAAEAEGFAVLTPQPPAPVVATAPAKKKPKKPKKR